MPRCNSGFGWPLGRVGDARVSDYAAREITAEQMGSCRSERCHLRAVSLVSRANGRLECVFSWCRVRRGIRVVTAVVACRDRTRDGRFVGLFAFGVLTCGIWERHSGSDYGYFGRAAAQ